MIGRLVVFGMVVGCVGAEVGSRGEAVQHGFEDSDRYRLANESSEPLLAAVANIRHYYSIEGCDECGEGEEPYVLPAANCGATFISPHFAVTASHCVKDLVESYPLAEGEFFVEQIDISGFSQSQARNIGDVTGTNYEAWGTGSSWNLPTGYQVDREICSVKCSRQTTPCVSAAIDIALIECPDRDSDGWAYVGNTPESIGDEVEVWWFHEYLDLPTTGTIGQERYDHYQRRYDINGVNGVHDDSFHYIYENFIYWPMVGDEDLSGDPAIVNGGTSANGQFSTNLFGCHGTSGAGVFGRGSTAMYGPVATASIGGLCGEGIRPVSQIYAAQLQARTDVQNDRIGNYP